MTNNRPMIVENLLVRILKTLILSHIITQHPIHRDILRVINHTNPLKKVKIRFLALTKVVVGVMRLTTSDLYRYSSLQQDFKMIG